MLIVAAILALVVLGSSPAPKKKVDIFAPDAVRDPDTSAVVMGGAFLTVDLPQQVPVQWQVPAPGSAPLGWTVPEESVVPESFKTAALGCAAGAVTGAKYGSSAGPKGTAVGAATGCVAGAILAFVGGNEEQVSITRVPWDSRPEWKHAKQYDNDTLWVEIVDVTGAKGVVQRQERIIRESAIPPWPDYELGRRVLS